MRAIRNAYESKANNNQILYYARNYNISELDGQSLDPNNPQDDNTYEVRCAGLETKTFLLETSNIRDPATGFLTNSTAYFYDNSSPIPETTTTITFKTFVIDHPKDPENKQLVHVCLEGPEAGVYYRGKGEVIDNQFVTISLPDYVPGWAYDFTVNVTAIYDGKVKVYAVSEVDENGKFNVYGENGKFNWQAIGKRADIVVEPLKTEINVKGFGPYKWVE
jgi:hypothetical protein